MKKEEIKQHLAVYKNVTEMINEAVRLKESGESEIMVNRCVAELRKELLTKSNSLVKLNKVSLKETELQPVAFMQIEVASLATPKVSYENGVITL